MPTHRDDRINYEEASHTDVSRLRQRQRSNSVHPCADSAVEGIRARWTNHTPFFHHVIMLPLIPARLTQGARMIGLSTA